MHPRGQAATEVVVVHAVRVNRALPLRSGRVPRVLPRALTCVVASALLLTGCGQAGPGLPPPGAAGTVVINIWDADGQPPTVLVAERIRQEGVRFERLAIERVRARIVLPDFDCAVTAPSGSWSGKLNQLTLAGPVHLAGTWQSSPLLGAASSARLSQDGGALLFEHLELWHRGQRLTAPLAEMRRDHSMIAPRGMDSAPLPPELAAVLAALPDPLTLPR